MKVKEKNHEQMQGYMQMKGDSYVNKSSQLIKGLSEKNFLKYLVSDKEWEEGETYRGRGKCLKQRR